MTYIEGFVCAVPSANKEAYRRHAADAAPLFKEFGVTRMVETWGDDVPTGKVTDFPGAVQAKDDETVVFSWFEYPDKATRDSAGARIMADPRMEAMSKDMPFDGKRMIHGGFDSFVDEAGSGPTNYWSVIQLIEGAPADVVVYDYENLTPLPDEVAYDLPGGDWRRIQRAEGYRYTIVNGEVTFEDGKCTEATPGRLLRHGEG